MSREWGAQDTPRYCVRRTAAASDGHVAFAASERKNHGNEQVDVESVRKIVAYTLRPGAWETDLMYSILRQDFRCGVPF